MSTKNKFIGSGIIFPIKLNQRGRPEIISDKTLIEASITMVLNWRIRTRYFNEAFGSRLEDILEEPDDSITKALLRFFINESIAKWEKRVDIGKIDLFSPEPNRIDARLFYRIKNTKDEDVMIFPFYKSINY